MLFFYLLLCYGLCFGFQNKIPFLYGKLSILDRALKCTYCTGFHCGWMVWLLVWAATGTPMAEGAIAIPASVLGWSFASAAFCYAVDAGIKWLEVNSSTE